MQSLVNQLLTSKNYLERVKELSLEESLYLIDIKLFQMEIDDIERFKEVILDSTPVLKALLIRYKGGKEEVLKTVIHKCFNEDFIKEKLNHKSIGVYKETRLKAYKIIAPHLFEY
jgi:hypothetical protein